MLRTSGEDNIVGTYHLSDVRIGHDTPTRTMRPKSVRLLVDPEVIRVGIRKCGDLWRASVRRIGQEENYSIVALEEVPEDAINKALSRAETLGMEGLNLKLDWAYTHPFLKEWR